MQTPKEILLKYWGYSSFRENQEEIINLILKKKDTLALLPTAGGKSICYQIPTLIMDGICIVISPLISLMKDQVENIKSKGIKAIALTSDLDFKEVDIALTNCIFGGYKFLYISPERLQNELVQSKISEMNVNLIAIDEAHCISEWGHNFRPSYRNISLIRKIHPETPVLALTATATKDVVDDIQENLNFKETNLIRSSFYRENLSYIVIKEKDKNRKLINILNKINGSAIVYVKSRKDCSDTCKILVDNKGHKEYFSNLCHAAFPDTKRILFVNRGVDITRPLSAQNDCFWWGYHNFSKLNKPYRTFKKIIRGYDPSLIDNFADIQEKIVCSLYQGPLSNKKIIAGLFNDSGKILDLFESK